MVRKDIVMARYISAGIDIGSHATRVAIAEVGKNGQDFRIIGTGESESSGLRRGYIVNKYDASESIRAAVARAEQSAGTKIRSALIAIGGVGLESHVGSGSAIVSRVDGEIGENDVQKVLDISERTASIANKKIINRFPLSFKVDGTPTFGHPAGMRGVKLEVETLFITAADQHLDTLIHTIEDAGIEVEDVVASPLAASLVTLNKTQRTAGCVLADIGAQTVSIGIFEHDYLVSLRVFPLGSTDITNDIALGLKISLEEAESLKKIRAHTNPHHEETIRTIVEARLGDVFEQIESHLKKIGKSRLLPAGIIVVGGGSGITNIEDLAKMTLELPARRAVAHPAFSSVGAHHMWAVAHGLCLLGMNNSYQSDITRIRATHFSDYIKKVIGWSKQFLP